jgi:hypothetical protein
MQEFCCFKPVSLSSLSALVVPRILRIDEGRITTSHIHGSDKDASSLKQVRLTVS